MAIQLSTGLRNALLASGSLSDTLNLGKIKIYSGTAPSSANDAEGTVLVEITVSSGATGLTFEASATNGSLQKNAGETWSGTVSTPGTATYYRHVGASDTGVSSTTEPRIQGTVAVAGADMNLSDVNLLSAATQTVDYYVVNMPSA